MNGRDWTRIGGSAAAALTLIVTVAVTPASATDVTDVFEFGYFEGETYADAYDVMVEYNGAAATEAFFQSRLEAGEGVEDVFPAFEGLSDEQQQQILQESAAAADDVATLSPEVGSIETAAAMAVPPATVLGAATANRRAWKATARYNWATCDPFCHVDDWYEVRHTVNPGHTSSRTDITLIRFGSRLGAGVTIDAAVYGNGNFKDNNIATWWANGTGIIYHFYSSLNNQTYVYWENWIVSTPNGPKTSPAWKTGSGGDCYTSAAVGQICDW
jgi:hypothetical protein